MKKSGFIYILTNKINNVLYTGVTSDLVKRIWEHKNKLAKGFSGKYDADKLVYFEIFDRVEDAIAREKQIKGGSRRKKIALIESVNPEWNDLYDELI